MTKNQKKETLIDFEAALAKLPPRNRQVHTGRKNGVSDESREKKYKKRDGYNSKPKAVKVDIPERLCKGRGHLGGGCGKKFKPEHRHNFIGPCCTGYLERYA